MKPIASPLSIIDFAVTKLDYQFIPPNKAVADPTQVFGAYDLDLDFGIVSEDNYIKVFIKAEVNKGEKKLPGYSFLSEVACFFKYNENLSISDEVKDQLEGFSTIYIALNSLRGVISNFTANAPFGRYILPSIDLNDLIEKKKQQLFQTKSVKTSSVTKTGKSKLKSKKK